MHTTETATRLKSLTSIRFFAALWVIVFHQTVPTGLLSRLVASTPSAISNVAHCGYAAVGFFFVLSGFILTYTYRQPTLSLRSFWVARFARIYPVYVLGLLMIAPLIARNVAVHRTTWADQLSAAIPAIFLLQSWIPKYAMAINGPGWSLSDEAMFYLAFPLLLMIARPLQQRGLLWLMLGAGAAVFVAPLMAVAFRVPAFGTVPAIYDVAADPSGWINFIKFHPLVRLPEFALGVAVGRLFLMRGDAQGQGWRWCVPALAAIGICCAFLGPVIPYPVMHNAILTGWAAMLVWGLARGGFMDTLLQHRWLVRLGEASYAAYILHMPIAEWVLAADAKALHLATGHPTFLFLVYLGCVQVVAVLTFNWIEEPARHFLRAKLAPRKVEKIDERRAGIVAATNFYAGAK